MLLRPGNEEKIFSRNPVVKIIASIVAGVVFLQIVYMIFFTSPSNSVTGEVAASVNAGTVEAIGRELFTNYILPFEAAGYLLLAAAIGALVLAKKKFE
jgi:NADH-quinone oxidoreductase subunit J